MAANGHFGCPKSTFVRISRHFNTQLLFTNGRRRSFWMSNLQCFGDKFMACIHKPFLYKMATSRRLGSPIGTKHNIIGLFLCVTSMTTCMSCANWCIGDRVTAHTSLGVRRRCRRQRRN